MLRRKGFALAVNLLLMAAVLYVIIGLYLPSGRRMIVGVDKNSGRVRTVQQRVAFLPWHQYYRLDFDRREGAAQTNGLIRITSKEGVPVKINYRLRFSIASERLPDARSLVRDGWSGWLRKRVGEAVSAVTQQVPIEDFASPTSAFTTQRAALREIVKRHLARSGLTVTAFEIEDIEIDKEALLRYKRAELRRNARGTFANVAVFAIDGADWELLTELMIDERIPNIEALVKGGTTGSLQTIQPTVSPLLWATVSTGVTPDRHGILDFVERRQGGAPVDARSRLVPAVWEIADAFGRQVVVSNWWASWPPSTGGTYYGSPIHVQNRSVYPEQLQPLVRRVLVAEPMVQYPQVRRFLNITQSEYDDAMKVGPSDPTALFRSMLIKNWNDHRASIELYRARKPSLMMVGFETTDFVNHLFAPYHPPYREGIPQTSYRKFWPAVANYYAEVDRMIGEWMRILPPDTNVMIVSAHGMRWGKDRPRVQPDGTSALGAHRNPGVFIAYGPQVMPSPARRPATIFDIAPTILALQGLPKSREMQGQPINWAFRDLIPVTGVSVGSYQDFITRKVIPVAASNDPAGYKTRLQEIGHLADPKRVAMPLVAEEEAPEATPIAPQQWGMYAHLNNTAIELKKQKKYREAIETIEQAIQLNPSRPTPYLNLAMILVERQQYTVAENLLVKAVTLGLPNPEKYFLDFAAYYRANDMPTRAIGLLYKAKSLFPQSQLIAANLGSALASAERYTDAQPELERALALEPASTRALNNLGVLHLRKKELSRALDYWNRSLAIDPRQPEVRKAANAVRTRL